MAGTKVSICTNVAAKERLIGEVAALCVTLFNKGCKNCTVCGGGIQKLHTRQEVVPLGYKTKVFLCHMGNYMGLVLPLTWELTSWCRTYPPAGNQSMIYWKCSITTQYWLRKYVLWFEFRIIICTDRGTEFIAYSVLRCVVSLDKVLHSIDRIQIESYTTCSQVTIWHTVRHICEIYTHK